MDEVAVGVFEGGDPAAPGLLLRGAYKLNPFIRQAAVLDVDVVNAQIDHDAEGVPGGAFDGGVEAETQAHFAESEGDKIAVIGVQWKAKGIPVENSHRVQV